MKDLKKYGLRTENKCFVVAEIGINHGGNIETAKRLIESASKTGVDAVKFQTYITEKRVPKDSPLFSILKECELPQKAFKELKRYSEEHGLEFFSTPFDEESLSCLNELGCNLFKVASFDVTNHRFLSQIASLGKTVVMSVGMSNLDEIKEAYEILRSKTDKIAILHCISAYPTKEKDANLSAIYVLKNKFDCIIGQSDHRDDIAISVLAVVAGAQIIEKHFMIDEKMRCVDAPVSITEKKMKKMIEEIRKIENILGNAEFGIREAEKDCKILRRYSK